MPAHKMPVNWFVNDDGIITRDKVHLWDYVEDRVMPPAIFWAPTFLDICRTLPRCKGLADAFDTSSPEVTIQKFAVYFVVDQSNRVTTRVNTAARTWHRVGNPRGTVFATTSFEQAWRRANNNLDEHLAPTHLALKGATAGTFVLDDGDPDNYDEDTDNYEDEKDADGDTDDEL
ncbi:hypothetical protein B0H16DRAFT_1477356 [Mycena metata]|uniref:Uncharacterized protein n=1 Tax=Mycena metata TaxID=1033252 RepID=A0AAD7MG78_9AGAR|nr:hypothetical protein B0H16DRAFT_1477356 [Mycena metata]